MAFLIDFMQPAGGDADIQVPAATFRQVFRSLIGDGARGVIAPVSARVLHRAAGANFSVDIQPFQAIVDGTDVTDQGHYLVTNTAVYNLTNAAFVAPGSGTRTHRVIARVRDKRAVGSWTTYDWIPDVQADVGSGEPALAPSSVTLAHVSIAAGQASIQDSNITQGYTVLRDLNIRGPFFSFQASAGAWNNINTWNDFTGGQWPTITFTVPPSGMVFVTISSGLNISSGTGMVGWRISGSDTLANNFSRSYGVGSQSRGSRRTLVQGLTPGGTDTITPGWYQTVNATSDTAEGTLYVEPVQ